MAHAMLVTIDGALGPFSIDDRFLVTEVDEMQNPLKTRLEVTLGRLACHCIMWVGDRMPQEGAQGNDLQRFDADFQIGSHMRISKKHAKIYWSHERKTFEVKSICKNAIKVN
eukprot:2615939-Rhodomonas_salina.2